MVIARLDAGLLARLLPDFNFCALYDCATGATDDNLAFFSDPQFVVIKLDDCRYHVLPQRQVA